MWIMWIKIFSSTSQFLIPSFSSTLSAILRLLRISNMNLGLMLFLHEIIDLE